MRDYDDTTDLVNAELLTAIGLLQSGEE